MPSKAPCWVSGGGNSEEMEDSFKELNLMEEKRQTHTASESDSGMRKATS